MMQFEIKDRDASARLGRLHTLHGIVTTPTLLPVINPNKVVISPKEMKERFGVEMVITNSYIIRKHERLHKKAVEEGVHALIDFDGPIMTDSGTFQAYVYGSVDVEPLEIVEFQKNIGVDVGTILDVFGTPDQTKKEAESGMKETLKRAKVSVAIKEEMGIACPVQGSIYPDLRFKCAQEVSKLDADLFPIGGVVPLMENQRYADLAKIILASKKGLDPSKPVHLFGAGHPLIFPLAAALGCDIFDSSAYVKYAQEDRMIFSNGTAHLKDMDEIPCCCPICSKWGVDELKKSDKKTRIRCISEHNLYISMKEIKEIRNAIRIGKLWELVEEKSVQNPWLYDAIQVIESDQEKEWLELFEPIHKKKALFYTGSHTIHRPIIFRLFHRLRQWYTISDKTVIVFPEKTKPYSVSYEHEINTILKKNPNVEIVVDSSLGPVPIFLDEMYPFAQSVFPLNVDSMTSQITKEFFKDFLKDKTVIQWQGKKTLDLIKPAKSMQHEVDLNVRRVFAVASMQLGKNVADTLFNGDISMVTSKKTGKIRNVLCDKDHIVSMRASDGLFTLKLHGGKRLHESFPFPRFRIIIDDDAVPFVKEGKSVFSKFVVNGDLMLRPYDECIVVDKKDNFLGVGRCLLTVNEMIAFDFGQAVKMREHISVDSE